ncbi:MAG: hypothetical protein HY681_02270 [Chloroflexi bacterium]|nr:hypothetical protein [Chloroflexota bacterium]
MGTLVDVQATSLVEISSFSIEAPAQGRLDFTVRGDVGFSASHLREHMLGGERVKVTYVREGDGLRALRVEDAP